MALVPKLELRQGQQLVMTPQLQQAIRLLQLSNVEVCSFVEAEVERNPLLEHEEVGPEPAPAALLPAGEGQGEDGDEWVAGTGPQANGHSGEDNEANGAAQTNGTPHETAAWAALRPRTHTTFGADDTNLEDYVAARLSLADHLTEQLHVVVIDAAERLIGAHLIHALD